jgi:hypothetical protein
LYHRSVRKSTAAVQIAVDGNHAIAGGGALEPQASGVLWFCHSSRQQLAAPGQLS